MANNPGQQGRPIPPGQGPGGLMQQHGVNQPLPQGIPFPPQIKQVSPQEIENYRKTHPSAANMPSDMIYSMLVKLKADAFARKYLESQGINRPGLMGPKPQGPMAQAPVGQPRMSVSPAQPAITQTAPQKQPPVQPESTNPPPKNARQPQQMSRPNQPTPSPAATQKNLKRPNPDDSLEMSNQNSTAQAAQRTVPQQDARQGAQPTPEQLARLPPDQRAKFEQVARNRQIPFTQDDMNRLKAISAEEQKALAQDPMPDIPMSLEERNETIVKIQETVKNMSRIGRGLGRWYAITPR